MIDMRTSDAVNIGRSKGLLNSFTSQIARRDRNDRRKVARTGVVSPLRKRAVPQLKFAGSALMLKLWLTTIRNTLFAVSAPMKCSFCGKRANEVKQLIAGPNIFICDECVDVCIEILGADSRWREHQIVNLKRIRHNRARRTAKFQTDETFRGARPAKREPGRSVVSGRHIEH